MYITSSNLTYFCFCLIFCKNNLQSNTISLNLFNETLLLSTNNADEHSIN